MRLRIGLTVALLGASVGGSVYAQGKIGQLPNGGYLLNNGWRVRAAGEQTAVDTFPMSEAISSDGKYLLALNGGIHPPSISVIDIASKKEVGRTPLPDAWLGLTAAPTGNLIYVGGGSSGKVYELTLGPDGKLTRTRDFTVTTSALPGAPFIGDVALSPDARVLYAADLYGDSIAQINLQSGKMVDHWKTGRRPYRIVVSPDGAHLLISSWAEATVYEHESGTGVLVTKLRVGLHPSDMLWVNKPFMTQANGASYIGRLFVAAANTNNVYSFGVTADGQLTRLDPISVTTTPMHPLGLMPSALASDAQGRRLYIACSGGNALAVADISVSPSVVLGFIPTAWYPTAVRSLENGVLAVVNGKGAGEANWPQAGSVEFLPHPSTATLDKSTQTVLGNSPYRDELIYGPITDAGEAYFSKTQGHPSPIQHVIYVIKGDQTYDELLGDLAKGNGDKSKVRFGEQVTPNLHKLAAEYVTYDNFYSEGDGSAEGQNWAAAAIAPDYTVKLWASAQAGRSKLSNFESGETVNLPPAGYLWSNAQQAGLNVRDYGEWVKNIPAGEVRQAQATGDPSLTGITDFNFRGPDTAYKDTDRAAEFIGEWKSFDAQAKAPDLSIVRLSNDAAQKGEAPAATLVSDNDRAVGALVDAVSHSKLWPSTAIFIVEASGAGGSDHVSTYRTPASVISPYTRLGAVDSGMFNQTGVLRTIEMILGMRPMTQFDAGSKTMFGSFSRQADAQPFSAR